MWRHIIHHFTLYFLCSSTIPENKQFDYESFQSDIPVLNSDLDRSHCKRQCNVCDRMMTKAKSKYSADVLFQNNPHNPRRLGHGTIRFKFSDKVQNIPSVQKIEIRFKMKFLNMRQKIK